MKPTVYVKINKIVEFNCGIFKMLTLSLSLSLYIYIYIKERQLDLRLGYVLDT